MIGASGNAVPTATGPDRGRPFAELLRRRTAAGAAAPALVMGVVNVTPDSFSDGGRFFEAASAIAEGRRMAADGAAILDIGGESTRPNAEPVTAGEERQRILPVIEALSARAIHVGDSGAGNVAKLVNNLLCAAHMLTTA